MGMLGNLLPSSSLIATRTRLGLNRVFALPEKTDLLVKEHGF